MSPSQCREGIPRWRDDTTDTRCPCSIQRVATSWTKSSAPPADGCSVSRQLRIEILKYARPFQFSSPIHGSDARSGRSSQDHDRRGEQSTFGDDPVRMKPDGDIRCGQSGGQAPCDARIPPPHQTRKGPNPSGCRIGKFSWAGRVLRQTRHLRGIHRCPNRGGHGIVVEAEDVEAIEDCSGIHKDSADSSRRYR
jgi:hypothetical protein